jgi:gluconate 2-dehydrogenase gamma chain
MATRRDFLRASTSTFGGAWMAARWPALLAAAGVARDALAAGASFSHLTPEEARDLEAIAAQIIPSDDSPGAREAGVIHFIDAALGSFAARRAESLRAGLAELNARVHAAQPHATHFAALDDDAQIAVLKREESTAFFGAVRFLTLAGMFALPGYGGNRDHIGWKLLGFDHRHVWAPPFGWYDAEAQRAEQNDGKA